MPEFHTILVRKIIKIPARIFMTFARKFKKIIEFYTIFARKNAWILHNNCPKNIFPEFFGAHCPPSPTPMGFKAIV